MTIAAAKQKLHDYIDHADEKRVMDLLAMFDDNAGKSNIAYDEETLNMLRERSAEYHSGKHPGYTVEESMELLRQHRLQNGI